jgi:hypothetical protein
MKNRVLWYGSIFSLVTLNRHFLPRNDPLARADNFLAILRKTPLDFSKIMRLFGMPKCALFGVGNRGRFGPLFGPFRTIFWTPPDHFLDPSESIFWTTFWTIFFDIFWYSEKKDRFLSTLVTSSQGSKCFRVLSTSCFVARTRWRWH